VNHLATSAIIVTGRHKQNSMRGKPTPSASPAINDYGSLLAPLTIAVAA
jgi:hypothetical protein